MPGQKPTHWISVVGARPQFIKVAMICRAIEKHNSERCPQIRHAIVHTGQHYDYEMTDTFFSQLDIPEPAYNLGVNSGSFGQQLGQMVEELEPILVAEKPDWLLIYGDTNSTLAGALVAARQRVPLAHVEAGCRSFRAAMPEEQNRVLSDQLSRLLLVPSQTAADNLHREGIGCADDPLQRRVIWVGDTMLDALQCSLAMAEAHSAAVFESMGVEPGSYLLLTLHRAENTRSPETLARVLGALERQSVPVIFPIHPRTRKLLGSEWAGQRVRVVAPVSYLEMLTLEKHAKTIITDSGGVQKEAFYLHVPCVTLRQETEWPETVVCGANRLTGTVPESILDALNSSFTDPDTLGDPFGTGDSGERIVRTLLRFRSSDFQPSTSLRAAAA